MHVASALATLCTWFKIKNHIERLPIVRHLLVQTGEIEFILDVILIDLKIDSLAISSTFDRRYDDPASSATWKQLKCLPRKRIRCREVRRTTKSMKLLRSYSFSQSTTVNKSRISSTQNHNRSLKQQTRKKKKTKNENSNRNKMALRRHHMHRQTKYS